MNQAGSLAFFSAGRRDAFMLRRRPSCIAQLVFSGLLLIIPTDILSHRKTRHVLPDSHRRRMQNTRPLPTRRDGRYIRAGYTPLR